MHLSPVMVVFILPVVSALRKSEKIVGGFKMSIEQAPYQVNLQISNGSEEWAKNCGGAILSSSFVLTAGHCCDK